MSANQSPRRPARRRWPEWAAALSGVLVGAYTLAALAFPLKVMALLLLLGITACGVVTGAVLLGSLKRLILAMMIVDIPVQIDLNLARNELMAFLDGIAGLSISVVTIGLVVLYTIWLAEIATRRAPPPRLATLRATSLPILAYVAVNLLSMFFARDLTLWLFGFNLIAQSLLLYIYVVHTIRTRQDVLFIYFFVVVGLCVESLFIFAVRVIGSGLDLVVISLHIDATGRSGGTLGSPNVAGSMLSLLMVLTFSLMVTPIHRWYKRFAALALLLGAGALILTGSRGAWISTFVGFGIFYWFCLRRGWLSLKLPVMAGLAAIPVPFFLRDMILMRLLGDDNNSAESRLPLYRLALSMIRDHWLFGIGANNFVANLPLYVTAEFSGAWIRVVHNRYLLTWAELGIGGLIAFLWLLWSIVARGWQVWQLDDRTLSPLALGIAAAVAGWSIHMFVAIFNGRANNFGLFLGAGMLVAMTRIWRREQCR